MRGSSPRDVGYAPAMHGGCRGEQGRLIHDGEISKLVRQYFFTPSNMPLSSSFSLSLSNKEGYYASIFLVPP